MLYSEPLEVSTIKKSDESWSVEELIETVPKTLLKDYVSIVKSKNWGIVLAPDRWISLLSDR